MLHTNVAELRLLCDTFTRVWSSGGEANLSLKTKDSQVWAKLDLQLGPADGRRPGPPEAEGMAEAQPRNHQETPVHPPKFPAQQGSPQQPPARYKVPGARARDARRRQEWLERRQPAALDKPASQQEHEQVDLEQTTPIIKLLQKPQNSLSTATDTELDKNTDTIPQLDGPPEIKRDKTAPVYI